MSYDDLGALGEYFSEFTLSGDTPTSLRKMGPLHQMPHGGYSMLPLGGLGATAPSGSPTAYYGFPSQPAGSGSVSPARVSAAVLQNYLNALQVPVTKSGRLDAGTQAAWSKYARAFKEPHKNIAPEQVDREGLKNPKNAYITAQALRRISDRAKATGRLRAEAARPIGSKPSSTAPATQKASAPSPTVRANVADLQRIMIALGVDPARIRDGKLGPTTKSKWQAATRQRGLPTTITGRTGATTATVNQNAFAKMRSLAMDAAPVKDTDQVISTAEAQSILQRLGYEDPGLKDGLFGPTTAGTWAQSAQKRNLDPFMAKKTSDGKQVVVRKETYLKLKADADAKISPREPDSLRQMDPKLVARIPLQRFQEVLTRVSGSMAGTLDEVYPKVAAQLKIDPRLEAEPPSTVVILRSAWDALEKRYAAMAPQKPAPGPQRTQLERDLERLVRESTESVRVKTIRKAYNAFVRDKRIAGPIVKTNMDWSPDMRLRIMKMLNVPESAKQLWENALVKGKLVTKDGKSVRLLPAAADTIRKAAAALTAAKAAAKEAVRGYTEVNAAKVIARINGLSVTDKKFDRSGGHKELADAVRTFLEETDRKIPAGDIVRVDSKGVTYVKDSVLAALDKAVQAAQARASATKRFRDNMVNEALQASPATITVADFQTAIVETLESGKAPKSARKIYAAVKQTGAFDKATRAAYTEVARRLTLEQPIREYEKLLRSQLGPNFKSSLVTEAYKQVWSEFLDRAVKKVDGKLSIKTLPAIAKKIETAVRVRKSRLGAKQAEAQARQEMLAEQKSQLAKAVKKSTAKLAMVYVQQGLLQMMQDKEIDATALRITGLGDAATRRALFELSGLIFPEGYTVPETLWQQYLNAVGIHVVSGSAKKRAWKDANYIALPPAVADLLSKAAGRWIAAKGEAPIKIVEFRDPSVITVRRGKVDFTKAPPKVAAKEAAKERVESAKPAAKDAADEKAAAEAAARKKAAAGAAARQKAAAEAAEKERQAQLAAQQAERERQAKEQAAAQAQQAQQAAREAALREQAARNAQDADAARQAAAEAQQAARLASQQAEEARAAAERERQARESAEQAAQESQAAAATAGGAEVTGPNITGPTINITAPEREPAVQQAGMGTGGMVLMGIAGLAALMLSQKGDER